MEMTSLSVPPGGLQGPVLPALSLSLPSWAPLILFLASPGLFTPPDPTPNGGGGLSSLGGSEME